jgi:TfoX/Sxy family transcriptional regulator of competence genes
MQWRKSPPELIARFAAALPDDAACERRTMFGYPAAFANGNMFTGLHQESMVLRLGADGRAALQRLGGQAFEPMPGRVMREYLAVPDVVLGDTRSLRRWVRKAFAYAASLPPKHRAKAATRAVKRGATASQAAARSAGRTTRPRPAGRTKRPRPD